MYPKIFRLNNYDMNRIELNNYITTNGDNGRSRVLTGKRKGEEVRIKSGIDEIFSGREVLTVVVPDDVFSVTPSFLEEMFKNVVRKYGSKAVLDKVKFTGKYRILPVFDEAVNRIAQKNSLLGLC